MSSPNQNIKVQKWITLMGVVLLCFKFLAYILTHSVAILTDALESIVNVLAGFIGWYSLHVSAKPRDEEHPYGHGKAEFVSATFEGTFIFLAGIFIIYQAIDNLIHPQVLHQLDWGILLIAVSGLMNFLAGKLAVKTGAKSNSMAVTASGKHLISDAYSTIALLVGLAILSITKIPWVDSVVAIIFSGIILYTGYKILRESIAGIMDEADAELLKELVDFLNKNRRVNWIDMHNLRVIKYGSQLHLDCHLTLPWYFNLLEAHKEIDVLYDLVSSHFGNAIEIFVHTDPCMPFSCKLCMKEDCDVRQHPFQQKIDWTIENIFIDKKHHLSNEQSIVKS